MSDIDTNNEPSNKLSLFNKKNMSKDEALAETQSAIRSLLIGAFGGVPIAIWFWELRL